MILPQTEALEKFHRYPLTWTLFALNFVIFVMFFAGRPDRFYAQNILKPESAMITGRLYHQFLQSLTTAEQKTRADWAMKLAPESNDHMELLGAYALRDKEFLAQALTREFEGDQILIEKWRQDVADFGKFYSEQVIYSFGLNSDFTSIKTWITYQFSHAGWMHLFSNMLFLIVIGTAVEVWVGSFALVLVYVVGGFAGGLSFLSYNVHGAIPMVGASASVSALLAFYLVIETRRRIRYVFFISPFQGQNGFIYLPTLLIFPLFLLVDFTSLMATPEGLGSGVAYSAHIGGTFFGFITGLFARFVLNVKRPLVFQDEAPLEEKHSESL